MVGGARRVAGLVGGRKFDSCPASWRNRRREWVSYDKERPLRQTNLREIGSAAAAYVVLLDPETNLRQAIILDERTIDIQPPLVQTEIARRLD
jgi:hypothetical protein